MNGGRFFLAICCATLSALVLGSCDDDDDSPAPEQTRTYRMGFSGIPPRDSLELAIQAIDLWSLRADAAIMSFEIPWEPLLAGIPAETVVVRVEEPLADYYRSKGHELWIYLDPANGLNRAGESDPLVAAGRSITEPEIQALFRRFAVVIDSLIRPEHLGLALETNLIRGIAPPAIYAAVRQVANDAAADVRAIDPAVKLGFSVQVDFAWGLAAGPYQGIATDLADFPFVEELGLSSYPYLAGFAAPESLPEDYYSRLVEGLDLPVAAVEGGWTSETVSGIVSSPAVQRRWILRQSELLDTAGAIALFQLTFTDLDLSSFPFPPGSPLPLFAHLGLVTVDLAPKPALGAWDSVFVRRWVGD
jgi:hypothetical protein